MHFQISEIQLSKNYHEYDNYETENLSDLSKINIFIGSNNSGKSRLMRKLFADTDLKIKLSQIDTPKFIEEFNNLKSKIIEGSKQHLHFRISEFVEKELGEITFDEFFYNGFSVTESVQRLTNLGQVDTYQHLLSQGSPHDRRSLGDYDPANLNLTLQSKPITESIGLLNSINRLKSLITSAFQGINAINFKCIYIPTMRGLRNIQLIESENLFFNTKIDNYLIRTIHDYFPNFEESFGKLDDGKDREIFTGLKLYEKITDHLLNIKEKRTQINQFELFIGETFFGGKEFSIVPHKSDQILYVKIGEQKERPIYQLGDGIQSIIILTFLLFLYQGENIIFFIEEPENYLHPGFQRIFIETLLNQKYNFNGYQYFITTHSNHLLDLSVDFDKTSIFTLSKDFDDEENEEFFVIENVENEDKRTLQLIGARNSSVFLSNCTIWVEGITDRFYVKKFLEIYQENKFGRTVFREDIHYSFFEYGGGNITHFSFLECEDEAFPNINIQSLCGNIFLISDEDGTGFNNDGTIPAQPSAKFRRHIALQKYFGDERYHCLPCREIENILHPEILKKVVKSYEKKPDDLVFNQFEYANYKHRYIGEFIEEKVENFTRKGGYKADSGTIKDKVTFSKRAVNELKRIEDLTQDSINLCEKLFDFIDENNSFEFQE